MRMLRCAAVLEKTGLTRSPLYDLMLSGLWTRSIKIGGSRAAGWPEHEVDKLIAARIAGASDAEIKRLVEHLHEQRKTALAELRESMSAWA